MSYVVLITVKVDVDFHFKGRKRERMEYFKNEIPKLYKFEDQGLVRLEHYNMLYVKNYDYMLRCF